MTMTVRDLLDMLEGMDENAEVRLAHQPSWPFEYSVSDVQEVTVGGWDDDDLPDLENMTAQEGQRLREGEEVNEKATKVVYLAEGGQLGYLPGEVCKALGWR